MTAVLRNQPMMRVGIAAADTSKAVFVHVDAVRLPNHIEFRDSTAANLAEYEKDVARTHQSLHDQLFPGIETRPPWRIVVLKAPKSVVSEEQPSVDIFFAFHHALMGGTGGRDFHVELAAALNDPATSAEPLSDPLLPFPDAPRIPESQEDAVPLKNSYWFLAKTVWGMTAPPALKKKEEKIWAGADIDLSRLNTTIVRPVHVSAEVLGSMLKAAREHKATLTTLMEALVLAALARHIPADQVAGLKSTVPISLMPYARPDIDAEVKDKLRTIVTAHTRSHHVASVRKLHDAKDEDLDALIWAAAAQGRAALGEKLKSLPDDDVAGLMPMISDMFKFFNDKDGKPREASFEVSNVGVLAAATPADADEGGRRGWVIERAMFTNSASVTGAAMSANMASVAGGGLTVALVRGEGVVEADLMEDVADELEAWMTNLHETGKFAAVQDE